MWPTLQILGVAVQTYPLFVLLGAMAAAWVVQRAAREQEIAAGRAYDLIFYALLAAVLGARLGFVLLHWRPYLDAPLSILALTPTALWWPGALTAGGAVAWVLMRRYRLPAGKTLDAASVGLAAGMAAERLGAFLSGRGLGTPTALPWGVSMWGAVRHPVQLYEFGALGAIAILLWRRQGREPFPGHSAALFVLLYAGMRLWFEAFRAQTPLLAGGWRAVQIAALAIAIGALAYLYRRWFRPVETVAGPREEGADGRAGEPVG